MITFDEPLTLDAWLRIRGMTKKEFSEAIGVNIATVSGWTNGRHSPNTDIIDRIEEVLETEWKTIKLSSK